MCTEYAQGVKIAELRSKCHQESISEEKNKNLKRARFVQFGPEVTVLHQLVSLGKILEIFIKEIRKEL